MILKETFCNFIKKNGFNTSYLWGYNQTYPIIKVENIDYTTLNTAVYSVGGGNLEILLMAIGDLKSDNQKNLWKTFDTDLRTALQSTSTAMVTTYTYKPLVGITSQTDPNGVTTYYEYDDFGRLSAIRDQNRNILKTYSYHYKQ